MAHKSVGILRGLIVAFKLNRQELRAVFDALRPFLVCRARDASE